jgi:hypothetical protein
MKTGCRLVGGLAYFLVGEVEPRYHEALLDLAFEPFGDRFRKCFPADSPHLDLAYRNFGRYAEEMILQTAGARPVPWEEALLAFLQAVKGQNIDWWLAGSAALAVRGMDLAPRDLDLVVAASDSMRLGDLLLDYLVEPVIPVTDWFCSWWGRAFLHARIEWVGGVNEMADEPAVSDYGPTAASRLDTVLWKGYPLRVPPLDLQLMVNEKRGLADRVALIRQHLAR